VLGGFIGREPNHHWNQPFLGKDTQGIPPGEWPADKQGPSSPDSTDPLKSKARSFTNLQCRGGDGHPDQLRQQQHQRDATLQRQQHQQQAAPAATIGSIGRISGKVRISIHISCGSNISGTRLSRLESSATAHQLRHVTSAAAREMHISCGTSAAAPISSDVSCGPRHPRKASWDRPTPQPKGGSICAVSKPLLAEDCFVLH